MLVACSAPGGRDNALAVQLNVAGSREHPTSSRRVALHLVRLGQ